MVTHFVLLFPDGASIINEPTHKWVLDGETRFIFDERSSDK